MGVDARANDILLRRRRKLIVEPGGDRLPLEAVASVLKNLEPLGFTCSPRLIERLQTQSERELSELYRHLAATLQKMVGADVVWAPMYPNFPAQVMDADEAELYLNALMHYLGDWIGARIMPVYDKEARPALADTLDLEVIDLGTEEELCEIGRQLMGANASLSSTDRGDITWFIVRYAETLERVLPQAIPHKENLVTITQLLMRHTRRADLLLTPYFKTATDVLRLATALSDGDVSLAARTPYAPFKRPERRLLLALLDRVDAPLEDMQRHLGKWKRLGERLHPGEHRARYPRAAEAFDRLRAGRLVRTFNAHVEDKLVEAARAGDVGPVLTLLKKRPGELARRLDHLLRLSADPEAVLSALAEAAPAVSTPVLLQVRAHFLARPAPGPLRAFFPKGNLAKVYTAPHELLPLDEPTCQRAATIAREALVARFATRASLGKVFVDEALKDFLVPFSQRSASKALRTLVRGSSLPLPAGDTLRFFLWWKEGAVAGQKTGRVDIDLSAVMYDARWKYKEHVSYTNLKAAGYRAVHSGDITSAPEGACEFIDLDVPSVVGHGGRYVVMSVTSFTGQPFSTIPECYAGWMARQEPGSGEVFEPATVRDKIDLAADTRIAIPVVLDLVGRRLYWADLALRRHPAYHINIEGNQRGMVHLGLAITTLVKPDLYDLFDMHAEARGQRVDAPEQADAVFDTRAAFELERVMAEFL